MGYLNTPDIKNSKYIMDKILPKHKLGKVRALDCGSGIGRITINLLRYYFKEIHLLEPVTSLIEKSKENLSKYDNKFVYINTGLENFNFNEKYDLIWIQWVLGYLNDDDLTSFLLKCKNNLSENGLIIIKENIASDNFYADLEENNIIRSDNHFKYILKNNNLNLNILEEINQPEFPKDLFKVKSYICK